MDVDTHGPLFNGQALRLLDGMDSDIERTLGDLGVDLVHQQLRQVLQHPTGYYENHIMAEPDGGDVAITDNGIVYGPWLEGTGSRNRTTRFKGYATFRRVRQELDGRAGLVAEDVAHLYVRRMG